MRPSLSMRIRSSVLALTALVGMSSAQDIVLDSPVRAGELTLFPSRSQPAVYYYLSDKPRLAVDERGRPEFSFLRWVENVAGSGGQDAPLEGEGGGIVHAVVTLEVTEDQVSEAQSRLDRLSPGSRIEGPVLYTEGTFGLVTSFTDENGELATSVVGLGKAPLLDGHRAAVSILLTKKGAKLLWESFQTATPDISFTFEMNVQGYRSPRQAILTADWEQIYDHALFAGAVEAELLGAEVEAAFDDLLREGAIRLVQVGDDENLDALVSTAFEKVMNMMLESASGGQGPSISDVARGMDEMARPSLLERASQLRADRQSDARQENERIRGERREAIERQREREAEAEAEAEEREAAAEEREADREEAGDQGADAPADARDGADLEDDSAFDEEAVSGSGTEEDPWVMPEMVITPPPRPTPK